MSKPTPFFVTGLPRSRTAWAATWLTTERSVCYHDVPYHEALLADNRKVGFSGPELAAQWFPIHQAHPEARWLVLERDPAEALAAFKARANGELHASPETIDGWWQNRVGILKDIAATPMALALSWNGLDHLELAERAWTWLLPELTFERKRWELLCHMNIQQKH